MMQKQYFVIKNSIFNFDLSPMDIVVYSAIASMINKKTQNIVAKYSAIAKRANVSQASVIRSVKILRDKGLIHKQNRFNNDGHYISSLYRLVNLCSKNYVMLPSDIWEYNLSPSAFLVYLYLNSKCRVSNECFPSLRQMKAALKLSLPTISKSLKEIETIALMVKSFYMTQKADFGHNRYQIWNKLHSNKKACPNNYKYTVVKTSKGIYNIISSHTNTLDIEREFRIIKQLVA